MRFIRRSYPLVAAVVLICLAVVLGLLAIDVRSWQGRMTRDDLRFRAHQSAKVFSCSVTIVSFLQKYVYLSH